MRQRHWLPRRFSSQWQATQTVERIYTVVTVYEGILRQRNARTNGTATGKLATPLSKSELNEPRIVCSRQVMPCKLGKVRISSAFGVHNVWASRFVWSSVCLVLKKAFPPVELTGCLKKVYHKNENEKNGRASCDKRSLIRASADVAKV